MFLVKNSFDLWSKSMGFSGYIFQIVRLVY